MRLNSINYLFFLFVGLVYIPNGWLLDLWGGEDLLVERVYFLILFSVGAYSVAVNHVSSKVFNWIIVFYLTLGASLLINIVDLGVDKPEAVGDFVSEWVRYVVCFSVAHFIYHSANSDLSSIYIEKTVVRVTRYLVYGQLLFFLIFISPLAGYVEGFYSSKSILNVKFDGTLSNPNYFAYTFSLFFFLTWWHRHLFSRLEFFVICVAILFLTIMTGSKTGFIVICVQGILYFPYLSAFFAVMLFPIIEDVMSVNMRIYHIYEYLTSGTSMESFDERHVIVLRSLQSISENMLFGQAIRDDTNNIVDNYYIGRLLRYGIIGFSIQLLVVCVLLLRCIRNFSIFIYLSPTIFLYLYTGEFLDNFRLYFFTALVFILAGATSAVSLDKFKVRGGRGKLSF